MNLDILGNALRLSLSDCNKIENQGDYIYAINEVLNRYKTNLFRLIEDVPGVLYDKKELINLRISGSYRVKLETEIHVSHTVTSPVLLHISGFNPIPGVKRNLEDNFIKSFDVSDIIDMEKIMTLKSLYEEPVGFVRLYANVEEDKIFRSIIGDRINDMSLYHFSEAGTDDIVKVSFHISGVINDRVLRDLYMQQAKEFTKGVVLERVRNGKRYCMR